MDPLTPVTAASAAELERLCAEFAAAWRHGREPTLESFLAQGDAAVQSELFCRLLAIEIDQRRRRGEMPNEATLHARFPAQRAAIVAALHGGCPTQSLNVDSLSTATALPVPLAGPTAASEHRDLTGQRLGRFELLELLGRGSFGAVIRARDPQLDRDVALKLPRHGRFDNAESEERFYREARAAAQLRHPNIVPVHDAGPVDDTYVIASEFIPGQTLRQAMQAGMPFDPPRFASLIRKLADALDYAHSKGIVHRDIKPENIMLTPDGEPHVMDFGLARREEHGSLETTAGLVMGTPAYMSPEQARGESHLADGRSDQWALGVILYELLVGVRPFDGGGHEVLHDILQREPQPPRSVRPRIPRDLETIALKCLAKAPSERYATCADLAADLQRYLNAQPIAARPIGPVERFTRWCRRSPLAATLTAAFLLALVTGTAVSTYFAIAAREQAAFFKKEEKRATLAAETAQNNEKKADSERAKAEYHQGVAEASQRELAQTLHFARLDLAQQALAAGDIVAAKNHIAQSRPRPDDKDLRHFEWYQLNERTQRDGKDLSAVHGIGRVAALAFAPDGQRLATAASHQIQLYDTHAAARVADLNGPKGDVTGLKFSADGLRLFASYGSHGYQGEVCEWDVEKKTVAHRWQVDDTPALCLDLSPGGEYLAVGFAPLNSNYAGPFDRFLSLQSDANGVLRVWDVKTKALKYTLEQPKAGIVSVAFSPDGQWVAFGDAKGFLRMLHLASGYSSRMWKVGDGYVWSVAFAPQGRYVATSCGAYSTPGQVRVWDADHGIEQLTLTGHDGCVFDIEFSPDGRLIGTASWDRTVRLWAAPPNLSGSQGQLLGVVHGHTQGVRSLAFSPDSAMFASGSYWGGELRLWNVDQQRQLFETWSGSNSTVSSGGKFLLRPAKRGLVQVDLETGQRRWLVATPTAPAVLQYWKLVDDDRLLILGGANGVPMAWDVATDRAVAELAPTGNYALRRVVGTTCVALYPTSPSGPPIFWDYRTRKPVSATDPRFADWQALDVFRGERVRWEAREPQGPVGWLRHAPDDAPEATHATVIDGLRQASFRWPKETRAQRVLVASPNGRWMVNATHYAPTLVVDVLKQAPHGELPVGAVAAAFSHDSARLITGGDTDHLVKVWDVAQKKLLLTLRGHTDVVWGVAESPDGKRIASAGWDGTVRLWDAHDGRSLAVLATPLSILWQVEFSRDGRVLWASDSRYTCVWRVGANESWTMVPSQGEDAAVGARRVAALAWPPRHAPEFLAVDSRHGQAAAKMADPPRFVEAPDARVAAPPREHVLTSPEEIFAALHPVELKLEAPPAVGEPLRFRCGFVNLTTTSIALGEGRRDFGTAQVWLERLGPESELPLTTSFDASKRRYAIGGRVLFAKSLAPGKGIDYRKSIPMEGFPTGKYRVSVQYYAGESPTATKEVSLEFDYPAKE